MIHCGTAMGLGRQGIENSEKAEKLTKEGVFLPFMVRNQPVVDLNRFPLKLLKEKVRLSVSLV